MQISFPYPEIESLEVPEENLLGVFSPSIVEVREGVEQIIDRALSNPIGSVALTRLLKGGEQVLIVVDDYTRSTPVQDILPRLIKELEHAGVKKGGIKILVALGTHRPMTEEEMVKKFGPKLSKQYPILNHSWWDPSQLINLGETEKGTPILVNRMVKEVDFIIGIGQIVPHRVSGFSGGGNIIQPGICGEETTGRTHWLSAQFKGRDILGKIENPVKEEIESVAKKVELKWIINTIQDGSGRLVAAVAGDPIHAYRIGAKRSLEVYRSELPGEADIVITDSHPYDSELWLAAKGIYAAELAVRQGGIIILVSPCQEGISPSHPEVLQWGYQGFEEANQKVQKGMIKKLTAAAHLVHVGRGIKERASGIMVSKGISKEETERLGLTHASSPQEALEIAFSILGRYAKVAVLQRGGEILPVIKEM
ncbi:MAG: nickel-dependent lactate racemase [Thermodesulfobacteriota bacterium]|nr:nickel-dependent lactate racemase [Thermodesulfobacteriota bacterium]